MPRFPFARPARLLLGLLALLLAVGGCSATSTLEPAPESESEEWSFTDDLGRSVTLTAPPARIAGLSDVLVSLVHYGVQPVASFGFAPIASEDRWAGLDTAGIVEVGSQYGEIDLEELAAAAPDLIVTHVYPTDTDTPIAEDALLYGFADEEQQQQVEQIAPVVAIAMRDSAVDVMASTADLAISLGVAEESGVLPESRAAYEAAAERVVKIAESGITVTAIAGYPSEGIYAARAADDPGLRSLTDLGLRYPDLAGVDFYWSIYSWENVDQVDTDVWLYSPRAMDAEELLDQKTFAATPAGAAGQLFPWETSGMDYVGQADYLTRLGDFLERAERVSG